MASREQAREAVRDMHSCLCGWRSESPDTHPHVTGCPVGVLAEVVERVLSARNVCEDVIVSPFDPEPRREP